VSTGRLVIGSLFFKFYVDALHDLSPGGVWTYTTPIVMHVDVVVGSLVTKLAFFSPQQQLWTLFDYITEHKQVRARFPQQPCLVIGCRSPDMFRYFSLLEIWDARHRRAPSSIRSHTAVERHFASTEHIWFWSRPFSRQAENPVGLRLGRINEALVCRCRRLGFKLGVIITLVFMVWR